MRYIIAILSLIPLAAFSQAPQFTLYGSGDKVTIPINDVAIIWDNGSGRSSIQTVDPRLKYVVQHSYSSTKTKFDGGLIEFTDFYTDEEFSICKYNILRFVAETSTRFAVITKRPDERRFLVKGTIATYNNLLDSLLTDQVGATESYADIDSSAVRGDSVFIYQNGVEIYTGLNEDAQPIDSTITRGDSIFVYQNGIEHFTGMTRPSVDSIQYVKDTTSLNPSLGAEFVNSTKDTSGVYDGLKWQLRFGGLASGNTNLTVSQSETTDTIFSDTGTDAVLQRPVQRAAPKNSTAEERARIYLTDDGPKVYDNLTSTEQVIKYDYDVASTSDVLSLTAVNNSIIRIEPTNVLYRVQSDSVATYAVDSAAVIPLQTGNYAVAIPNDANEIRASIFNSDGNNALGFSEKMGYDLLLDDSISLSGDYTVSTFTIRAIDGGRINTNGNSINFGSTANTYYGKDNLIAGDYKIFSDTLGVTFYGGSVDYVNVMWWGAVADVGGIASVIAPINSSGYPSATDNSPYFAAASRSLEYNDVGMTIRVPANNRGAYRMTRPWVIGGDATFFGQVNITGEESSSGYNAKSLIIADYYDGPAISIEGQRDCRIEHLGILGRNGANISFWRARGASAKSLYDGDFGSSNELGNTYSAIGIDAISANIRETSGVVIEDCAVMGFNVGVYISQARKLQGDFVTIKRNYFYANTIGILIGDDQSRTVNIEDNVFTVGHTAISNTPSFGSQGEAFPTIFGGWAISHYQSFALNTNTCGVPAITNWYTELTGRIGSFESSNLTDCNTIVFRDCQFRSLQQVQYTDSVFYQIETSVPLEFIGGTIDLRNIPTANLYIYNRASNPNLVSFENVHFWVEEGFGIYANAPRIEVRNSHIYTNGANTSSVYTTPTSSINSSGQIVNTTFLYCPLTLEKVVATGGDASVWDNEQPTFYALRNNEFLGKALSESSAIWSNDTLTLTLTDNNFSLSDLYVGDIIENTLPEEAASGAQPAFHVIHADRSSSTYLLKNIDKSRPYTSSSDYTLIFPIVKKATVSSLTGNTTTGSSLVTNVNYPGFWKQGDMIFGEGIRDGYTRVDSISNDTLWLTKTATATATGVKLRHFLSFVNLNELETIEASEVTVSGLDSTTVQGQLENHENRLVNADTTFHKNSGIFTTLVVAPVAETVTDGEFIRIDPSAGSGGSYTFNVTGMPDGAMFYVKVDSSALDPVVLDCDCTGFIRHDRSHDVADAVGTLSYSDTYEHFLWMKYDKGNNVLYYSDIPSNEDEVDSRLDSLESPSRASVYISSSNPDTITVITGGTYEDFTDLTEGAKTNNFTVNTTTGRMTYNGTETATFDVYWTASLTSDGTNENLLGRVETNSGATVISWEEEDTASGDSHSVAGNGEVTLSSGEWVQPRFTSQSNGIQMIFITMNFKVIEAE